MVWSSNAAVSNLENHNFKRSKGHLTKMLVFLSKRKGVASLRWLLAAGIPEISGFFEIDTFLGDMPRTRNHKLQPQAINERKSYQT